MTYIELIVVLSIFAIMSSLIMFNYGAFQAKVDIKNLASDIALQIVQAQKSALNGLLSAQIPTISPWKPAYGVYFNLTNSNQNFIYFADLNDDGLYTDAGCAGECLNQIAITKNDLISHLDVFYPDSTTASLNDLTISFKRPDSSAIIKSSGITVPVSYVQITVAAPNGATSLIKVYPSGRIQIN
jgi:type II secretory pathway pseudopilin PulG